MKFREATEADMREVDWATAQLLQRDMSIYGNAFLTEDGKRVDPAEVMREWEDEGA